MNWVVYASAAALALAAADVFVKSAAGKVSNGLGLLLYGVVPFLTGLSWYAIERFRGVSHASVQPEGIFYGLSVGVTFTLVTVAMYIAFRNGAPISIASPLIRLGGLLLASTIGFLIWKEPINARYLIGLALDCSGLYLIMTR